MYGNYGGVGFTRRYAVRNVIGGIAFGRAMHMVAVAGARSQDNSAVGCVVPYAFSPAGENR
jgi:hypothetical protein